MSTDCKSNCWTFVYKYIVMSSLDLLLEAFQEVNELIREGAVHSEVIDLVSESVSDGQHSDVLLEGHSDESNVQIVTHVEVVDLLSDTMSDDSSSGSADSTESVLGSVDYGANVEDVLAIQLMLESGRGVFGHTGCILERRISLLQGAGLGIFLSSSDSVIFTTRRLSRSYSRRDALIARSLFLSRSQSAFFFNSVSKCVRFSKPLSLPTSTIAPLFDFF